MLIDVVVHADTLCPWCYIQKRSLEAAMDRYQVRHPGVKFNVTWKPFLLHPTLRKCDKRALYENIMSPEKYKTLADRITTAAAAQNITLALSGTTGPSQPSHLLIAHTLATLGASAQAVVVEAIFKGHFEQGRDIADDQFLVEVGRGVGLDGDAVRQIIRWRPEDGEGMVSGRRGGAVEEEVRRAMVMGVRAVPCVTIGGRFMVGGYQEGRVFEEVFEKVRRERGR